MMEERFLGAWRLLSCELRAGDGEVIYPFGQDPVGYIMYTEPTFNTWRDLIHSSSSRVRR
jgi:hypothetical protein